MSLNATLVYLLWSCASGALLRFLTPNPMYLVPLCIGNVVLLHATEHYRAMYRGKISLRVQP